MAWTANEGAPSAESTSGKKLGLIVGVIVACIVVLGGGGAILALIVGGDEAVTPPPPPVAQPGPIPEQGAIASNPLGTQGTAAVPQQDGGSSLPADAGAQEESTVTITLEGVPEGATISLGEEPVTGTEIVRPRSSDAQSLRVELEGHQPWAEQVSFEQDRTLTVALVPEENEGGEESSSAEAASAGERRRGDRNRSRAAGRRQQQEGRERSSGSRGPGRRNVPGFDTTFN